MVEQNDLIYTVNTRRTLRRSLFGLIAGWVIVVALVAAGGKGHAVGFAGSVLAAGIIIGAFVGAKRLRRWEGSELRVNAKGLTLQLFRSGQPLGDHAKEYREISRIKLRPMRAGVGWSMRFQGVNFDLAIPISYFTIPERKIVWLLRPWSREARDMKPASAIRRRWKAAVKGLAAESTPGFPQETRPDAEDES